MFYDGGWFAEVSDYLTVHHPWRARIAFAGFHDAIRWWVCQRDGVEFDACILAQAHYVRGRSLAPSRVFDHALDEAGIVRHDAVLTGGHEKGADVLLALETFDQAVTARLDLVALVTGDVDFVPLVEKLDGRGIRTLIPTLDVRFTDAGTESTLRSAAALAATPAATVPLLDLVDTALRQGTPLRYPLVRPAQQPPERGTTPERRHHGIVTRWVAGDAYGFITDDEGRSWFASRDDTETHDALPVDSRVTFAGSPAPAPGKKYPRARSIRTT